MTEPPMTELGPAKPVEAVEAADPIRAADPVEAAKFSRRTLLRAAALGTVGSAGGAMLWSHRPSDGPGGGPLPRELGSTIAANPNQSKRILLVIEMAGGNDGLSTLVPFESGRYRDLRPTLAIEESEVVNWGDGWGLRSTLDPLTPFGLAAVVGIGARSPDLSHFEMQARWAAGEPNAIPTRAAGYFGRLCDALRSDSPLAGVSIADSTALAMVAETASTVGLSSAQGPGLLHEGSDVAQAAMRRAFDEMIGNREGPAAVFAGGISQALVVDDILSSLPEAIEREDDDAFGNQLRLALQLLRADVGVRVLHIQMDGGNFDTHKDHRSQHDRNMESLGRSLAAFSQDLADHNLADRVLIATTSEFGRRPEESDGGLDHGTASTVLLSGPVTSGIWGEHSSLDDLDDNGNLTATMEFDRYYASLATWLDIDPEQILERSLQPIEGLIST